MSAWGMEQGEHRDRLIEALGIEGFAHRMLLDGERETGQRAMRAASERYRESWEIAPPRSFGRLIGMLKAAIIAGDARAEADYVVATLAETVGDGPHSPSSGYARAIAALVRGEDAEAVRATEPMRAGDGAFSRAADAIVALATGDPEAYRAAERAIVADFESREEHLTRVPIADTALMLERLAEARGLGCGPASALLPAASSGQ